MLAFVSRSYASGAVAIEARRGIYSSRKHGGVVDRPSVTQTRHARATTIPETRSSGSSVWQSLFSRPWRGGTDFTWRVISSRDRRGNFANLFRKLENSSGIVKSPRLFLSCDVSLGYIILCPISCIITRKRVMAILTRPYYKIKILND